MAKYLVHRALFGIIFIAVFAIIVAVGRGYRINLKNGHINSTGIFSVSSSPSGAKIYIDDALKGISNTNITQSPGVYSIKITKEGFTPWKKQFTMKGEWVVQVDALLFPQNPSLSPITSLGVEKAVATADNTKILLFAKGDDLEKEGIYLLDNSKQLISITNPLKLLVLKSEFPISFEAQDTTVTFSPDNKECVIDILQSQDKSIIASYLLDTDRTNQIPFDITLSKSTLKEAWQEKEEKALKRILQTFKDPFPKIASSSFEIVNFSPDQNKILYQAKADIKIPIFIKPRLISTNQTDEIRSINSGNLYVYDKKEDKNYYLDTPAKTLSPKSDIANMFIWFPDSQHIIIKEKDKIAIMYYDGINETVVYSGPFEKEFLSVTSDGKLLILANLNKLTNKLPDVYSVGLR